VYRETIPVPGNKASMFTGNLKKTIFPAQSNASVYVKKEAIVAFAITDRQYFIHPFVISRKSIGRKCTLTFSCFTIPFDIYLRINDSKEKVQCFAAPNQNSIITVFHLTEPFPNLLQSYR